MLVVEWPTNYELILARKHLLQEATTNMDSNKQPHCRENIDEDATTIGSNSTKKVSNLLKSIDHVTEKTRNYWSMLIKQTKNIKILIRFGKKLFKTY